MSDLPLPWYASLVGMRAGRADLDRLSEELGLQDPPVRSGWMENPTGASVRLRDGIVVTVIIFPSEAEGYYGYAGHLPFDLAPDVARDSVHNRIGGPDYTRQSKGGNGLTPVQIDTYRRGELEVLLEYRTVDDRLHAIRLQLRGGLGAQSAS